MDRVTHEISSLAGIELISTRVREEDFLVFGSLQSQFDQECSFT